MTAPNPSTALAGVLVDELVRAGVTEAVVAPGSRSSAVAIALQDHPGIRVQVEIDERSAGFLSLGLGKGTGRPAVVLTTSGTAAVNLHPAIVEAHYSRTPLIALTADRPPELRQTGANQAIDQLQLFREVRWFAEVGVAEDRPASARYWRSTTARAVAEANGLSGPPGPVHLNLAFREPTVPETDDGRSVAEPFRSPVEGRRGGEPWVATERAPRRAEASQVERLAALLEASPRGLILAGESGCRPELIHDLAGRLGWPVVADPFSGARAGPASISTAHHLFGVTEFAQAHVPDMVLRLGGGPLSRNVGAALRGAGIHLVVDADGRWLDPDRNVTDLVVADPALLIDTLTQRLSGPGPGTWQGSWLAAEAAARSAIDVVLGEIEAPTEPRAARDVAVAAPRLLLVGSSMPVRDLDWFMAPRPDLRVLGNRGASGIDGFVSTALGAALAGGPAVALTGDLALLHDQNGFLLRPDGDLSCVFVVINNDGGGIFSFLPPARQPHFEKLFATPHGRRFEVLARLYDLGFERLERGDRLIPAVGEALAAGGLHVIEVPTDRAANVEVHRLVSERVAAALTGLLSADLSRP